MSEREKIQRLLCEWKSNISVRSFLDQEDYNEESPYIFPVIYRKLAFILGEPLRFRVTEEKFEETSPTGPDTGVERDNVEQKIPYCLTARINEPGLGLKSWWNQSQEAAADSEPENEQTVDE